MITLYNELKRSRKEWSFPNLSYYPDIFLEKITKHCIPVVSLPDNIYERDGLPFG